MKSNEEDIWVNVHDDNAMVALGIRAAVLNPIDCRTKTSKEKKDLKVARRRAGNSISHFGSMPRKFIPVMDKLIIYLSDLKKSNKSTISTVCWQSDIPQVLSLYGDSVKKYYWNGKTYKPNELPYWRFTS